MCGGGGGWLFAFLLLLWVVCFVVVVGGGGGGYRIYSQKNNGFELEKLLDICAWTTVQQTELTL